jgi:hypothetical protein
VRIGLKHQEKKVIFEAAARGFMAHLPTHENKKAAANCTKFRNPKPVFVELVQCLYSK